MVLKTLLHLIILFFYMFGILKCTLLIFFLWMLLSLFDSVFYLNLFILDLLFRIDINDSIVNLYNFTWTSLTYLTLLFGWFWLVFVNILNSSKKGIYYLVLITLMLSSTELWDFITFNNNYLSINVTVTDLNILLINSLNKYHPFILYLSAVFFFNLFYLYSKNNTYINKFLLNNLVNNYLFIEKSTLIVNAIALFLGSWWALQEGTWGGWWNWDSSEVLGLIITLSILFNLHFKSDQFLWNKNFRSTCKYLLLFALSYYFIQLNFDLTSHSFGSRFVHFFNTNLFLLKVILLYIFIYSYLNIIFMKNNIQILVLYTKALPFIYFRGGTFLFWFLTFYVISILFVIALSYSSLVNYFLWSFFKVNAFNSFFKLYLLTFYNFTLFSYIFLNLSSTNLLVVIILLTSLKLTYIYSIQNLIRLQLTLFSFIHFLLSFIFCLVINSYFINFFIVKVDITSYYSILPEVIFDLYSNSINNSFLNKSFIFNNFYNYNITFTNFFYKSNALKVNNFILIFDSESITSVYFNTLGWYNNSFVLGSNFIIEMSDLITTLVISLVIFFYFKMLYIWTY